MFNIFNRFSKQPEMSVAAQIKAGKSLPSDMEPEHVEFVEMVIGMLDRNEINVYQTDTFVKQDIYQKMDAEWKAKTDKAIINIALQLQHIERFYRSKATPNASKELMNMIEHLWQMKMRIEEKYDVFTF